MRTFWMRRAAQPDQPRADHDHDGEKFCGPCAANSILLFITTQWPLTLAIVVAVAALIYAMSRLF